MGDITAHVGEVYVVRVTWKWIDHPCPDGLQPGDKIVISRAPDSTQSHQRDKYYMPYEYLDQCGEPHETEWLRLFNWLDGPI